MGRGHTHRLEGFIRWAVPFGTALWADGETVGPGGRGTGWRRGHPGRLC